MPKIRMAYAAMHTGMQVPGPFVSSRCGLRIRIRFPVRVRIRVRIRLSVR